MLVLIVAIAIVGLCIMLILQSRTTRIIKQENEELLSTATQSVINSVEGWMNSTVARMDTQRKVLEAMNLTPEQERYYIQRAVDPTSPYPSGLYFGTQNKEMIHATFSDPSYDPTIRDWYRSGLNNSQFKFGGAYVDMDSGNVVVTASAALRDATGAVRGVAAGDVQLSEVFRLFRWFA
jgi:type II secretory pathway pseudopilin PulG